MTHVYDEKLRPKACDNLGRMLDFAVHSLRQDAVSMMDLFIASGLAARFGTGDIKLIAGMSGIELAYETLERSGLTYERTSPRHTASLSAEYWCGSTLASAQWELGCSFSTIMESFSVSGFLSDYSRKRVEFLDALPLDISSDDRTAKLKRFGSDYAEEAARSFSDVLSSGSSVADSSDTRLKKERIKNSLSQSQLAEASGVPLRTLQQYEQRQKDINKARSEYVLALSRVLGCDPSSLLEIRRGH